MQLWWAQRRRPTSPVLDVMHGPLLYREFFMYTVPLPLLLSPRLCDL